MRHVPPEGVLTQLLSAFGQEWLDGAKSIVRSKVHLQAEKLPAEDLNMDIEISSSGNQIADEDERLFDSKRKRKMWDDLSRTDLYEHLEACEDPQTLSRQLLDDVTSKDDLAGHLFDFSDGLKELHLRIKLLVDGDDLLATLTREWTAARSEVQEAVNQHFEAESELSDLRRKMELKKERDEASHEAQQLKEILQEMRAGSSRP